MGDNVGLFKHLYFDFSFLNPRKKKSAHAKTQSSINQPVQQNQAAVSSYVVKQEKHASHQQHTPVKNVHHHLLEKKPKSKLTLPSVRKVIEPPKFSTEQKTQTVKKDSDVTHTPSKQDFPQPDTTKPTNDVFTNDETTFFNQLYSHVSREEQYISSTLPRELLQKNLFDEMQTFWKGKKDEIHNLNVKKAIHSDLRYKIDKLHQLEIEWQKLQLSHEKIKDDLASKEILIENHIRSLKRAFKKAHLSSVVEEGKHFNMANGITLRSLQEFADHLRFMDEDVFLNHVNNQKNDFATWVHDVMGLKDLSYMLRKANSRTQMQQMIDHWSHSVDN